MRNKADTAPPWDSCTLERVLANFSVKGLRIGSLGLAIHMKATIGNP